MRRKGCFHKAREKRDGQRRLLEAFAIFAPGYGPDNYTPFARLIGKTQ
jgi:hypothetical protein